MRKLIAAFAAAAATSAMAAPQFEASLGISSAHLAPNGTWYQEGFPYSTKFNTPGATLGITDKFNDDWRWHAYYVYLGTKSSEALACDRDEHYTGGPDCGPNGNVARYVARGSGNGLALTAERALGHFPALALLSGATVEGGLYVFRPKNFVRVDGWKQSHDAEPETIYKINTRRFQVGYVLGASYSIDERWSIRLRRYFNRCLPSADACAWESTTTLSLAYRF